MNTTTVESNYTSTPSSEMDSQLYDHLSGQLEQLMSNVDQFYLLVNGMLVYSLNILCTSMSNANSSHDSQTKTGGTEKLLLSFLFLVAGGVGILDLTTSPSMDAGSVRSKNTTNILIKNLIDSFVAGIAYWLFGYAFAFGEGNKFIGYERGYFALSDPPDVKYAEFFFQYCFAATAATIVSGAVAERCEFLAFFVYSFFMTGFIYPVVTHWAWSSGGWLKLGQDYIIDGKSVTVGFQDFAGSGVVHVVGGASSIIGAILIGPRIGRFHSETKTVLGLRGHSVPLAALGGFILCFGFLAFNGGSQLNISGQGSGASASIAVVNTIISASASASFTLILGRTGVFGNSTWSLLVTLNGALAGMVAICAGCDKYYPWGAAVVGFVAAISYKFLSWLVVKLYVDDPLDAIAVHFGGGAWGLIAVAFLDKDTGIFLHWDKVSGLKLAWQLVGLCAIAAWSGLLCFLIFIVLKLTGYLRVSEEMERKGLDIPKHGEPSYPLESYGHGHIETIIRILESGQLEHFLQGGTFSVQIPGKKRNGQINEGFVRSESFQPNGNQLGFETPEVDALTNRNRHFNQEENTAL